MSDDYKQERACELCKYAFFDGDVNTNQHNLCEGSRCEQALELVEDELEEERITEREYKIDNLLNDES